MYDFDTVIDRRNDDSIKWKVAENELPMWVADMDFRTAPEILEALRNRLELGIFGYTDMGHEGSLSSGIVMLTTLGSSVTLTFWIYLLRSIGLV